MAYYNGRKILAVNLGRVAPSGTITIINNGTYNVSTKVSAVVSVARPTLHSPTISLEESILTITNPPTNGNYVSEYKVWCELGLVTNSVSTNIDLNDYFNDDDEHTIWVTTSASYFNSSTQSNEVTFIRTI